MTTLGFPGNAVIITGLNKKLSFFPVFVRVKYWSIQVPVRNIFFFGHSCKPLSMNGVYSFYVNYFSYMLWYPCKYYIARIYYANLLSSLLIRLSDTPRSSWWRHQMETFSALLAICAGNSLVTGGFTSQRLVTGSFNVFFHLRLNKRLSTQGWGWWFVTPSRPLWRHCKLQRQRQYYDFNNTLNPQETSPHKW